MTSITRLLATSACLLPLAGCMNDFEARSEGVSMGAGNAIATNTVLQMVDPWPAGVNDRRLRVPAYRPLCPASGCRAGAAPDAQ